MRRIKKVFGKFWQFLKKHKWSVLLVLTALAVGGFFIWDSYTATVDFDPSIDVPERPVFAPLSGLKIDQKTLKRRPLAVMVDNHPGARPQSGLNEADLVYEAVAEGGITRFVAVYHSREAEEIGPVRSARSYYVEWANSHGALYAHVGGSREAMNIIGGLGEFSLNEFAFENYFRRDPLRWSPHNVYTSVEKLRRAAESAGYSLEGEPEAYLFKKDLKEELRPEEQTFTINFDPGYAPSYTYDPDCNCYFRSVQGVEQTDRLTRERFVAKNVIVVFSDFGSRIIRSNAYTTIETTGSGTARIYQDGRMVSGTWRREPQKPIRFYDDEGEEIKLNRGTTWIGVVPQGAAVN